MNDPQEFGGPGSSGKVGPLPDPPYHTNAQTLPPMPPGHQVIRGGTRTCMGMVSFCLLCIISLIQIILIKGSSKFKHNYTNTYRLISSSQSSSKAGVPLPSRDKPGEVRGGGGVGGSDQLPDSVSMNPSPETLRAGHHRHIRCNEGRSNGSCWGEPRRLSIP